jgi:hypothetical protein
VATALVSVTAQVSRQVDRSRAPRGRRRLQQVDVVQEFPFCHPTFYAALIEGSTSSFWRIASIEAISSIRFSSRRVELIAAKNFVGSFLAKRASDRQFSRRWGSRNDCVGYWCVRARHWHVEAWRDLDDVELLAAGRCKASARNGTKFAKLKCFHGFDFLFDDCRIELRAVGPHGERAREPELRLF